MKTKLQPKILLLVCTLLFFVFQTKSFAGPSNFTWTGTTSTSWTTATNWTPNGVPSTSDTVTIVSGSRDVSLSGNITVKKFTITSGTVYLNDFTLTITTHATFTSGTITAGAGRLVVSSATSTTFSGTTFSVPTTITSNAVYLNGSTFNDSLTITKNGNSNDNSKGGNVYKKQFLLTNSAKGAFVLSDSFPDTYEKKLIIKNTNEGTVYLAHRASGTVFKDDVTFYGKNIYSNYYGTAEYQGNITLNCPAGNVYFGYGSGSSTLANTKRLQLGDSAFAAGKLTLMHFTKLGTDGEINLTLTGSAILTFESGTVINSTIAISSPTLYLHGARFNNLADMTVTGTSTASSEGGCYFAADAKITNNSSGTNSFALGNTVPDTFATTSTITNTKGTLSMNNAVFVGNTILKNVETATNSDRFIIASTGNCIFQGNIQIQNSVSGFCFGKTSGTASLASGKTLSFVSGFTGNLTLKNFTQLGSTAQSFSFTSTGQKLFLGPGSTFNGNFDFTGHFIVLNGTTFNGTATINRYGAVPDTCAGGNVFNSTTIIKDSTNAAYSYLMAYTNADDYNGDVTFIQKGSGAILYPCYNKNSTFAGNITVNSNSAFQFGVNGGKVILDGTTNQNLSNLSSYPVTMKKLQINKTANSFTLNFPLTVSDSLILTQGRINTDTLNLLSISNGGKLSGGSDNSYVNGPMKKTGNSAFVFPLGSSALTHPYHPLEITTPTSTTDAYTANYFSTSQTIGSAIDTSIDNLNACQYWKLNRNTGTSKVKVKIGWNNDSCETISPSNFRVTGWNGSMWKDLGNASTAGDSIQGTVQSLDSLNTIDVLTLAFKKCSAFRKTVSHYDVRCKGGSDGLASISVKGGTATYSYAWSNGMGASSVTRNLRAGTYAILSTDLRGCTLTDSVVIAEPDSISLSYTISESSCGNTSGSISVSPIGGVGALSYYWPFNGDTTYQLRNVPAGEYSVLVTDSNGCALIGKASITDSDGPGMNILSQTNLTCFGSDSGSVEIEGADMNAPFKYKWSRFDRDTLSSLNFLRAGFYEVQITNNQGCLTVDSIEIVEPDPIEVGFDIIGTPCGSSTGQILANVTGGTSHYSYDWSPSMDSDSLLTGLAPGIQSITVIDGNGCLLSRSAEVLSTSGFMVNASLISNSTCFLDSNGIATVQVSGGEAPYTFSWEPYGGTNDTAISLLSDFYQVTVIDSNGCRQKDSIFIDEPDELRIYFELANPTSDSTADGFVEPSVLGGTLPYLYSWSSGASTFNQYNLGIIIDTLTVIDAKQCKSIASMSLNIFPFYCDECDHSNFSPNCGTFSACTTGCTGIVTRSITDFGGIGDGTTDNECFFEEAAYFFQHILPSTPKILTIPAGTYLVGRQENANGWYLQGHAVMCFNSIQNLTIEGEKDPATNLPLSRIKILDCMKYGAFDPASGDRYIGSLANVCNGCTALGPNDYNKIAYIGPIFQFSSCDRIVLKNLELDGNIDNAIIGGGYTEGIQLNYDGIILSETNGLNFKNLIVHHFGHDGMWIKFRNCFPTRNLVNLNLTMDSCKFLYNGRNGVSWTGGRNFYAMNCEFSYTGMSRIASKPGDGLDIEIEGSQDVANGNFWKCSFRFNSFNGVQCDAGAQRYSFSDLKSHDFLFDNCIFVSGEHNYAAWPKAKNFTFQNCNFYGRITGTYNSPIKAGMTNNENTKFLICTFNEEYTIPGFGSPGSTRFYFNNSLDEFSGPNPCPIHGGGATHDFMLTVQSARTYFERCVINTNYTLKFGFFRGGFPIRNHIRLNTTSLYNYGLNECDCDNELSSWFGVDLNDNNHTHFLHQLMRHAPTGGCFNGGQPEYYMTYIQNCHCAVPDINTSSLCHSMLWYYDLVPQPLVPKYYDSIDPNKVTDLFTCIPCTLVVASPNCQPLLKRGEIRSNEEVSKENSFEIYPNPPSDFLIISNRGSETVFSISDALGHLLYENFKANENTLLNISKINPGIYFIRRLDNQSKKFIKFE